MSWKGDSWEQIVARAKAAGRRARTPEEPDRAALARRARRRPIPPPATLRLLEGGLSLGEGMHSVELAFAQLYHVEPVDPWPCLALGWVERGASYRTVIGPEEPAEDAARYAAAVEDLVALHGDRLADALERGWLDVPVVPWEPAEAMPGERDEGPAMRGYRLAPEVPDPILARRTIGGGPTRLLAWVWARLTRPPRRIEPREVVLTKRFVYVRARSGEALRVPAATLRTFRQTRDHDAIWVFGRCTELLLPRQEGCPLDAALQERLGAAPPAPPPDDPGAP